MEQRISLSTRTITPARNENLNESGHTDTNLYFIESASLRAFVCGDGVEQNIRSVYARNFMASLDPFLRMTRETLSRLKSLEPDQVIRRWCRSTSRS
jgi:hypothetical protein